MIPYTPNTLHTLTTLMYPVYFSGHGYEWVDLDYLKEAAEEFNHLPEEEQNNYQDDAPVAEFVTGLNTDSVADESIVACRRVWDRYSDECSEEGVEPNWDTYLDLCWDDFDFQCCYTWLRVLNLHLSDEVCEQESRSSTDSTMKGVLGLAQ